MEEKTIINHICNLEKQFSNNFYSGSGDAPFFIKEGIGPIMISAPHSIKQYREGNEKLADIYTGGIALYLHEVTKCHVICSSLYVQSDANYDAIGNNKYQEALREYIEKHNIKFLIDLHGASKNREYAIEMGTNPEQKPVKGEIYEEDPSLHQYKFVPKLVNNIFKKKFSCLNNDKKEIWKNRIFTAGEQNTVTKFISENTNTAGVQLEINGIYRNPNETENFLALVDGLRILIEKMQEKLGMDDNSDVAIVTINSAQKDDLKSAPDYKQIENISRTLSRELGCKYINVKNNEIRKKEYLRKSIYSKLEKIDFIISLEIAKSEEDVDVEIAVSRGNKNSLFFQNLAKYTFEYKLGGIKNSVKIMSLKDAVNDDIYSMIPIPIIIFKLNSDSLEKNEKRENYLWAIKMIINLLRDFDWDAEIIGVYRLWQAEAKKQIPQDKVEFFQSNNCNRMFEENSFLHLKSFYGEHETVRARIASTTSSKELNNYLNHNGITSFQENEFASLTNRMIENLFGREWCEKKEEQPGLFAIPVIIYENARECYRVGIPKANQVNDVSLSTELFAEKNKLSARYDYMIFNRYTDSRMFIEVEKTDYKDYGRVKGKKIMLPRYYRLMMGYLDKPLKNIREEEYLNFCNLLPDETPVNQEDFDIIYNKETSKNQYVLSTNLDDEEFQKVKKRVFNYLDEYDIDKNVIEESVFLKHYNSLIPHPLVSKDDFKVLYDIIPFQAYYQLKSNYEDKRFDKVRDRVIKELEDIGVYKNINMIRLPKQRNHSRGLWDRVKEKVNKYKTKVLSNTIGKAEYILKTSWAGETDDKNNVARLNSNIMSLLGVSENDKILIEFGKKKVTLRVLANDGLSNYEIAIPALARKKLDMNSINDIVIVYRDMEHAFKRHSQEQTIAILGTVLAAAQVLTGFSIFRETWWGVLIGIFICVIAIIVILYFALSEERVKVK